MGCNNFAIFVCKNLYHYIRLDLVDMVVVAVLVGARVGARVAVGGVARVVVRVADFQPVRVGSRGYYSCFRNRSYDLILSL